MGTKGAYKGTHRGWISAYHAGKLTHDALSHEESNGVSAFGVQSIIKPANPIWIQEKHAAFLRYLDGRSILPRFNFFGAVDPDGVRGARPNFSIMEGDSVTNQMVDVAVYSEGPLILLALSFDLVAPIAHFCNFISNLFNYSMKPFFLQK